MWPCEGLNLSEPQCLHLYNEPNGTESRLAVRTAHSPCARPSGWPEGVLSKWDCSAEMSSWVFLSSCCPNTSCVPRPQVDLKCMGWNKWVRRGLKTQGQRCASGNTGKVFGVWGLGGENVESDEMGSITGEHKEIGELFSFPKLMNHFGTL